MLLNHEAPMMRDVLFPFPCLCIVYLHASCAKFKPVNRNPFTGTSNSQPATAALEMKSAATITLALFVFLVLPTLIVGSYAVDGEGGRSSQPRPFYNLSDWATTEEHDPLGNLRFGKCCRKQGVSANALIACNYTFMIDVLESFKATKSNRSSEAVKNMIRTVVLISMQDKDKIAGCAFPKGVDTNRMNQCCSAAGFNYTCKTMCDRDYFIAGVKNGTAAMRNECGYSTTPSNGLVVFKCLRDMSGLLAYQLPQMSFLVQLIILVS